MGIFGTFFSSKMVIEKYNLDFIKMFFRLIFDYNNLAYNETPFNTNVNQKKLVAIKI
jgi:hypothetical protein